MKPFDELQSDRPQLSISPSEKSFSYFINKDYISPELREQLLVTNVLIVPNEGYGDLTDQPLFPAGTTDLYQYLAEREAEGISIGVCIEDENYKELSLHADWLILAEIVVKDILAPLLVALLAEYIIHVRGKRIKDTNVKSKLTIVDTKDKHKVEYHYEGPASEYKDLMLGAISKFEEDNQQTKIEKPKRKRKKRG